MIRKESAMKEYCNGFNTKNSENRISVRTENGTIVLGIDCGVNGMYETLTKKEVDELITILKTASKKIKE